MISREQIARSYALMECERAPCRDAGYGHYPSIHTADFFLSKGLIFKWEWSKFVTNQYVHGEHGHFKEEFLDLISRYEHENPLPAGWRYTIELENCFPVAQEISR